MHVSIKMRSFCHFLVPFLNLYIINNFLFVMICQVFFSLFLLYTFVILSIFKIILRGFGTQSKKEFTAAFRECFSRLGELRSLAPQRPLTPVLALTATATLKTQQSVERSLCLRKDCVKIYLSPNRSNIYLYKSRVTTEIDRSFQWLVDKLKSEKTAMGKTIVYCKSIKDCGRLFMFFKSQLGEHGYYPEDSPRTSANLLFGMYHHSTLNKQKSIILNSFHEEQGTIRLVFATNALGMGVNFSNVRTIIHYGPPRQMEDFVQQIGRAGRDGKPSKAVLFYNGLHLRNCDKNIKEYCSSNSGCLRKLLLAEFGSLEPEKGCDHDCCVHCHKDCLCEGEEGCSVSIPNIPPEEMKPSIQLKQRNVSKEQRALLTELLFDLKEKLSSGLLSYLSPECTTVFTSSLIKMVLKHSSRIFTKNYIMDNLPVFKTSHAVDILCMFHDVFEDIDLAELEVCATTHEELGHVTKCYDLEYGGIYQEMTEEFCLENDVLSDDEEFTL